MTQVCKLTIFRIDKDFVTRLLKPYFEKSANKIL